MKRAEEPRHPKRNTLLGLGFDNEDGETRLTRGKNFTLLGGSEETHAVMQETAVKVNEELKHHGKTMDDVTLPELTDIVMEVTEKIGAPPHRSPGSSRFPNSSDFPRNSDDSSPS